MNSATVQTECKRRQSTNSRRYPLGAHGAGTQISLAAGLAIFTAPIAPAATDAPRPAPEATTNAGQTQRIYIREIRVIGSKELPGVQVEDAVYPYLGPGRTLDDVEAARAALEEAYRQKGYQAASVEIPEQHGVHGIVFLKVNEGRVGQLRVKGSRYFLPSAIKARARSLAEGQAVNFNDVTRDIVALNQLPDRRVTPSLQPGIEPGTVDVDLNVVDKLPLHGSLELNNRASPDTTKLRLNGSLSYNNLWQQGHSIGGSFQLSPQDLEEVRVFSGYYIWRFPQIDWLSLLFQGTKSNSNVNTLGAFAVAGRGETIGARAVVTLPPGKNFYHSISAGFDYKHTEQMTLASQAGLSGGQSVTFEEANYLPLTATYSATWAPKGAITELTATVTAGLRGIGSRNRGRSDSATDPGGFDDFRAGADTNFITLRGELAHTHELPAGFQAYARVQGQISDQPLINTEQFAGGGQGTVRGYLEAESLGDNAVAGTVELRSPSLLGWFPGKPGEWRVYLFGDAGKLTLHSPLPEQQSSFKLASFGIGSQVQLFSFLNGSIDFAIPATSEGQTRSGEPLLNFRVWADF